MSMAHLEERSRYDGRARRRRKRIPESGFTGLARIASVLPQVPRAAVEQVPRLPPLEFLRWAQERDGAIGVEGGARLSQYPELGMECGRRHVEPFQLRSLRCLLLSLPCAHDLVGDVHESPGIRG